MAVHRAGITETEVFKQRQRLLGVFRFACQGFDFVFDFLGKLHRAGQFVQYFARLGFDGAQQAVHIAHDVAGEVFRQRTDIGGNRHFVVVEDDQQIDIHIACAVQGFKRLTCRHGSVADDGDAAAVVAQLFVRNGHAQSRADGCGRMAYAERVVFRLAAFRKTGQTAVLTHGVHLIFAAGEDFVRIALVADIPDQMVFGRVVHIMQRHRQLDRAQVTGEMAARLTDGIQQKFAQFGGDLRQLFFLQTAQILRRIDNIEQRAWVHDFWR